MTSLTRSTVLRVLNEPKRDKWRMYKAFYAKYTGIILADWQEQTCQAIFNYSRFLLNWGRGMSKTLLLCLVSVFFAMLGMKVCYCVPRTDELTQPLEYFNNNPFVDDNPHKKGNDKSVIIEKARWFSVLGKPMIKITNIDDKGFNLSSGRFNVVIYDECALLMYYKLEVELLNKGKGLLRAMDYPHVIYASTPLVGSHFYEIFEHYPGHQKSWRNFENTPNNFITNTKEKLEQLLEERLEAEQMGILYAWETENLAIPHTASGAAYKNLVVHTSLDDYPSQIPSHCGFDFHGYATGHIWVAFYYNPQQSLKDVWVLYEGAETYDEADTADESMEFLESPFFAPMLLRGESGGMINDPYIKAGRKWGMNSVSINGEEKHDLEANILNYRIHLIKNRTPKFADDIANAEWKDPNKFELHKESAGVKFRNHYLDAFMNVLPAFSVGKIYIPNKRLRGKSFEQMDRDAHRVKVGFY